MPWNEYVFDSPLARSPQSSADDWLSIVHPPRSVILWRSYQRSGVRKTSPRWGMAAPVLVTLITSWTVSPTLAAWLPPPSTAAARSTGAEPEPAARSEATSPTNYRSRP